MNIDYNTYKQIEQLLILLDGFAVSMHHDYNLMSEGQRGNIYDQQLTATRALREITGLNAHKAKVEEEIKQDQLRVMEEHKEKIEEFISTVNQELSSIEAPACFREYKINNEATSTEDLFNVSIDCTPMPPIEEPVYPNTTKEEWLASVEAAQKRYQEKYDADKEYSDPNSEYNKTFITAFGLPHNSFFPAPSLREVFVDENILALTKGFMCGPVGLFNNRPVAAETQRYPSLAEMITFLGTQAKTNDIVIYLTYKEGDDNYYFRGAVVPHEA